MPLIGIGRRAPTFEARDQSGKRRALADFRGRTVVLYFYPKDETPGCTTQACQFRDHHPDFSKVKATILGVSPDDEASHARFSRGHALDFPLLVDVPDASGTARVCDLYGVWQEKAMYGRRYMGVVRTTYLIDPDGRVVRRWDRVRAGGHAEEVLGAVRALRSGQRLVTADATPRRVKKGKSARRSRVQAGHAGYSGVPATGRKATRDLTTALRAGARPVKVRAKATPLKRTGTARPVMVRSPRAGAAGPRSPA